MLLAYVSAAIEKLCTNSRTMRKELPQAAAKMLPQRLVQLAAFANLGEIPLMASPLHLHPLREDHAGHFAVRVCKKYRVVFKPTGAFTCREDGSPELSSVVAIEIVAVEDYHDD